MLYPTLDEIRKKYYNFDRVPILKEILFDTSTPITLVNTFKNSKYLSLLESVESGEKRGRYSFIGKDPERVYKYYNDYVIIENKNGKIVKERVNPKKHIEKILSERKSPQIDNIPRLSGGLIGYFSYDSIRLVENIPDNNSDDYDIPLILLMEFNEIFAFDHVKQKLNIIVNIQPKNNNIKEQYEEAQKRIIELEKEISKKSNIYKKKIEKINIESNMSQEEFENIVRRAKEYIYKGDIFQVVLSQRLKVKTSIDPFYIYRMLRGINPSPYMFFIKMDKTYLTGASPEMLVRINDNIVETCPIAGTRKRTGNKKEEDLLSKELLNDEKEVAEHNMLVDLGRNDIGKISKPGSVFVDKYMEIQKFSHVMHITSNVKGEKMDDRSIVDALMALIPAGTLSGAPKVRAMEIIDELEKTKRGPYGGAVGYFSYNNNCDFCITIRTFLFNNDYGYLQVGAGIVADSEPTKEFDETLAKAKALITALEKAGE